MAKRAFGSLNNSGLMASLWTLDMPGTNGLEATHCIKGNLAGTTVIILSALDGEASRKAAAECGADSFLSKTASISEILTAIRRGDRRRLLRNAIDFESEPDERFKGRVTRWKKPELRALGGLTSRRLLSGSG